MPKGSSIIKNRKVGARIGRYLESADLEAMTKGLPRAEAYRLIAARVKHEVENLRDQARRPFDAKELRKLWKAERRKTVNSQE
jgi:alpha-ketoglutarate-dependent taurine dioxygenase